MLVTILLDLLFPLVPDGVEEGAARVGRDAGLAGEVILVVLHPVPHLDDFTWILWVLFFDEIILIAPDGGPAVEEIQRRGFSLGGSGVVASFVDHEENGGVAHVIPVGLNGRAVGHRVDLGKLARAARRRVARVEDGDLDASELGQVAGLLELASAVAVLNRSSIR